MNCIKRLSGYQASDFRLETWEKAEEIRHTEKSPYPPFVKGAVRGKTNSRA